MATEVKEKHPPGLYVLFFTEMWERFGFYLLIGILPLYLMDGQKGGLEWTEKQMAALMGTYLALVYFTPFIGGLIADRLLGCRKTIVIGGILMMAGYFTIAIPGETAVYVGLGLVILGNGAFKPNISTILGNLYPPGSNLRDTGYNIFYMGINIGAFTCNIVAALVRNYFDARYDSLGIRGWSAAFSSAGFGMLLGLIIFAIYYRRLAVGDPDPRRATASKESLQPLVVECLIPATLFSVVAYFLVKTQQIAFNPITAAFLAACLPVIFFYIRIWRKVEDPADRGRVGALLTVFGVVIIFWAIFHLNTTALNIWTEKNTDRESGTAMRVVTDRIEEFAELARPSYFFNAGPEVPRPHPDTFRIVSEEEYKRLEADKKLTEGDRVYITQKDFDRVYAGATADTPRLKPGESLRLVNTETYQSINPAFVVLFTPLVVAFFAWLRKRGKEPSTPAKLGLGLLLTSCAPLVMLAATYVSRDGAVKASSYWLFGVYTMATLGELCLSPMGLSLVNKMSPTNIRAFMMGGWFLSTSFGNKLSGIFGELYTEMDHYVFWPVLAGTGAFFGVVIFLLLPWLNRQMTERKA